LDVVISGVIFVIVLVIILGFSAHGYRGEEESRLMILKLIYTFLIGIFLAVFVGVGISAFYPGPKFPEQPVALKYCSPEMFKDPSEYQEFKTEAEKFDLIEKDFRAQSQIYNRNVSIIALTASIIIVVASLTLFRAILLIADGLLLGGVLTLIYSVIRGFEAEDNIFRFMVVSVGLFVSLALGYLKFIKPAKK